MGRGAHPARGHVLPAQLRGDGAGVGERWPLILVAVGLGFIVGSFQRAGVEVTHEKK